MPINQLTEDGFGMLVGSSGSEPFSFGNALQFDGTDDYVDYSEINFSPSFTVSIWFKTDETYQNYLVTNSDGVRGLRITETVLTLVTLAGGRNFTLGSAITLSAWNHVVITRDILNVCNVYVNGIASINNGVGFGGDLPLSSFGRRASLRNAYTLDEAAVWDINLSSSECNSLYNSGNGDYATNYSPANLIAYWRCNETDGATTLTDEQGNYDGTLNNFSTPPAYFIPH